MAEAATAWTSLPAWSGVIEAGRFGEAGQAGVTVQAQDAPCIASLVATPGSEAALEAAVRDGFGIDLPHRPAIAYGAAHAVMWNGPGQWLLLAESRAGFHEALGSLAGAAAVSYQSDSRAMLHLSGPLVRDVLAKGCMVDLHPAVFPVGAVALTSITHVAVALWRAPDGPDGATFGVMVPRSLTGSFWSWFTASAAEFGCTVAIGPPARS